MNYEATPHADFAVFDAAFTAHYQGREWPEECARMHLRWLVGERVTGSMQAREWPTVRALATKWGWRSIERVSRFLTRTVEVELKIDGQLVRVTMLHWQDPYRRIPLEELRGDRLMGVNRSGSRTGGERETNGGRTAQTEQAPQSEQEPNGGRTGDEREANAVRVFSARVHSPQDPPPEGGTRTREPGPPTPTPTPTPTADLEDEPGPVVLPDGRELPGNLPALLDGISGGFGRMHRLCRQLAEAGYPTTRQLLELPAGRLRFQRHGLTDADDRDVDEVLRRRWGIGAGALATPPAADSRGPPSRAAPYRQPSVRELLSMNFDQPTTRIVIDPEVPDAHR